MPKPVVVPQQPIGWNLDPTTFNFGIVNQHSLLLGSAERADVVVDFSAYAGKTLILYNDAPAAFPAGVRALRLLHRRREPDGRRRRAHHAARLRSQHPDDHADPGGDTP